VETVLVVEDSRPMQRTLQRLFEADSLQVAMASDGPAGLDSFRKQPPDAVVLDLKLPGMSGKELCREFKSLASSIPIVVLSANAEVDDKVLLLELGADDYVTKPFSPKELLARVRRAMRRGSVKPLAFTGVPVKNASHQVLSFGDARIDFTSMEASRAGAPVAMTAQEVWRYEHQPDLDSTYCSSAYQTGSSYLVDYALASNGTNLRLIGLNQNREVVFDMAFATSGCQTSWNSISIPFDNLQFE